MRGMAEGAGISLDHIVLTTLHEEIFVLDTHCTAFAATDSATRSGNALVAMNWDWNTNLHRWPGLLRLDVQDWPRMLTYHYPGLWAGAGINEAGMAFMWTGAGFFPRRKELAEGVPTYVLINEILRRSTVGETLEFLDSVPFAGAFIFFLGDADGRTALVEGLPDHMTVVEDQDTVTRANHYECPPARSASRQEIPEPEESTTCYRAGRMEELISENRGRLDVAEGRRIMTDRDGEWPWLHQYPGRTGRDAITLRAMTIDSLIADCENRVLHTCRGGRTPGPWQRVPVG